MRMTNRITRGSVFLLVIILLLIVMPGFAEAVTDPIVDLTDAVSYWQEQAVQAAIERDKLRAQVTQLEGERDRLLADRAALEEIVTRLQAERNEALDNARAEASLRQQAEHDLEIAIGTIKSLEQALKRLAGPRFGVIMGATYDIGTRDPGLLAALQIVFQ